MYCELVSCLNSGTSLERPAPSLFQIVLPLRPLSLIQSGIDFSSSQIGLHLLQIAGS